jgi:DNA-binding NtrC family response regulator
MSSPRADVSCRLAPLRVLVTSPDHHYRAAMSLLLARRNCSVTSSGTAVGLSESLAAEVCDVVVLDASADGAAASLDALEALPRRMGVVVVSDGSSPLGARLMETMAKWGPFDELMAAIERADPRHAAREASEARDRS